MSILIPRDQAIVTLPEPHDPHEYYKTRSGLYVYSDYRARIVDKCEGEKDTQPTPAGTRIVIGSADVASGLVPTDRVIENELPGGYYLCERGMLCAGAAATIDLQQGGITGALDHSGAVTLAYTLQWVVHIYYDAMNKKWTLATWSRNAARFRPVTRVIWFLAEV